MSYEDILFLMNSLDSWFFWNKFFSNSFISWRTSSLKNKMSFFIPSGFNSTIISFLDWDDSGKLEKLL